MSHLPSSARLLSLAELCCVLGQAFDPCCTILTLAASPSLKWPPHLVVRAHSEPTATAYLAALQPTYSKAAGRGLRGSKR